VRPAQLPAFAVIGETVVDLFDPGDGSACLARDPLGTVLYRHLERSRVGTAHVVRAAEPSTMALVELSGGQPRYEFSVEGTAD
jgi:fructokinase